MTTSPKKNSVWIDWFADEFIRRTQISPDGSVNERVPWSLIEDKGIELKIVDTDERGWFEILRRKWEDIFPEKWCQEAQSSILSGEPVMKPGEKEQPQPVRPVANNWGLYDRRW